MGGRQSLPKFEVSPDRTFIVTGANTGIGYETAKQIAQIGGRVVIACRSEERAEQAISRMRKETEEERALATGESKDGTGTDVGAAKPLNVQYMHLDLSSLQSTTDFAQRYKESGLPLHVLICNAGISAMEKGLTDDGFERMFQINYLSHFLLTLLLLPLLKKSAPNSRIINVSSEMYRIVRAVDLENIQAQQSFSTHRFYGQSKIFQMMNMYTLAERIKDSKVSVFSHHPGVVTTEISREAQGVTKMIMNLIFYLPSVKDSKTGCAPTLNAALNPEYDDKTAIHFALLQPTEPSGIARRKDLQDTLWQYSLQCLRGYLNDGILQEVEETMTNIEPLVGIPDKPAQHKEASDAIDDDAGKSAK